MKNVENTADGAYTAGYNWAKYFERCNSVYFEGRAKRARDVYWAKYNGDSPDDPDNPDNPDDPNNPDNPHNPDRPEPNPNPGTGVL